MAFSRRRPQIFKCIKTYTAKECIFFFSNLAFRRLTGHPALDFTTPQAQTFVPIPASNIVPDF